ncbi:hypothetical protein [Spirosoma utsteinense]|uniref:Uncharacterized protein n=1 Tax=Spirosoma utsteinense TaxID=2585773 RepID=A0ABR6W4U2_9BACT|nr:hypothetical protein [Spirosoma utsteinense]MBC3788056.1 hypothetical protein [Spirosoma utsteinense]MBC3791239.1 hypothetical protein [Spirosoma utsteinense]
MKNRISSKINALQGAATSQEDFMKKLAQIDEKGQLTEEAQIAVNGGASLTGGLVKSPLIDVPLLGLWVPTFPDTFDQAS